MERGYLSPQSTMSVECRMSPRGYGLEPWQKTKTILVPFVSKKTAFGEYNFIKCC